MRDSALQQNIKVQQGAYLPHWTADGAIYHVVFRLGDSLPAVAVDRYRAEHKLLLAEASRQKSPSAHRDSQLRALFRERIESLLDRGLGACWLARENIATLTADALHHFNGERYILHAWCVMPNHVHVVVQPKSGRSLPEILKSWKGLIALKANRALSRTGKFWQPEYYDHLIRNEAELARAVSYVHLNPLGGGLINWRWVWPRMD